jgi:outer membrane receptor for ferrienterochelin and colicins
MNKKLTFCILFSIIFTIPVFAQVKSFLAGQVKDKNNQLLQYVLVGVMGSNFSNLTDSAGRFVITGLSIGNYQLKASAVGFKSVIQSIEVKDDLLNLTFILEQDKGTNLNDVVVTGTLKPVNKLESPVPVEVYTPAFFKKNPTPNIYEALQNVNGVRPQLNCNICNTGDIHINGLEGPYTMILIDGMPIVSSLSTVYGLSGIPNSLVERIEIVKGPASSLYGSEAVGGLINIITKNPSTSPKLSIDVFNTSWNELNTDLGFKFSLGKKVDVLTGINYFRYDEIFDKNNDNFTDVTNQNRISLFQKWNINRAENRVFTVVGRYNYEDRWGGDVNWNKSFRGGEDLYAESIYTRRYEFIGNYQLPISTEKLMLSFSFNNHNQDSYYGSTPYLANQKVAFSQLIWDKNVKNHSLLFGGALRYTYYDDNTPATAKPNGLANSPENTYLPGVFVQDEITLNPKQKLLLGMRYDYNSNHGNIFTPRIAYKLDINKKNILRLNAGTGFRVVNLFTEDHAALTGAREVVITEDLKPERSYNVNLNYIKKLYDKGGNIFNFDASVFYTRFNNRINGNFDVDPNKIIYANLNGNAISQGITLNFDASFVNGLKVITGATLLDVYNNVDDGNGLLEKTDLILTEKWTGTWSISYPFTKIGLSLDYTGNIYGPMRLPLLSETDPRGEFSPVWSIQNIQATYVFQKKFEIYGGVKNLLNFTPGRKDPFLIARSNDPFDKNVQFDTDGKVVATANNPYALTFDPSFVFAPNQGIRGFLGLRYTFN